MKNFSLVALCSMLLLIPACWNKSCSTCKTTHVTTAPAETQATEQSAATESSVDAMEDMAPEASQDSDLK